MKATIRLANENDAFQMLSIYAPIVRETPTSFEVEPPSEAEFKQRIKDYQKRLPWLVCELDGEILGYAYANPHRSRAAYQWSVESSVYVAAKHRKKSVGKALYASLFKVLQVQGFYNVFAGIVLPNPASIALHEAFGFTLVGVYRAVGYKLGQWYDVGWWQLSLQHERSELVNPPLSWQEVEKLPLWNEALRSGLNFLRV
ncbi:MULTISPECIES: arsinothricin resistance N-acetyltransferase ArsN1 family B [Nostocales]|uniref:GCN5 family acetyltransferase n=4 Tax=Nostocales TaxID=1161 RepID=A0A0C1N336_9CYAN|nr:arsinothricin resistance N-acetyltransferase ArsN1 family B [Tolypothrix bouteillei]